MQATHVGVLFAHQPTIGLPDIHLSHMTNHAGTLHKSLLTLVIAFAKVFGYRLWCRKRQKGDTKMENQTRTAESNEEIYRLIAEMFYQRAKPIFEEQERVLMQKLEAIENSVTNLLGILEAANGISSALVEARETSREEAGSEQAVITPAS